jgi:L-asparaginase / beta-aspartyl-peptidase
MLSTPPQTHPHVPASRRGTSATLLTRARNPSQLVRALYLAPEELEPHPFLSGTNAEDIAHTRGAVLVDPSYFYTRARWLEHRRGLGLPDDDPEGGNNDKEPEQPLDLVPRGTVGAVALDERGAICAVTSTGGRTNKLVGRIGDTPHMGAGFWAEQWSLGGVRAAWAKVCGKDAVKGVGVSGTGDGDVRTAWFIESLRITDS